MPSVDGDSGRDDRRSGLLSAIVIADSTAAQARIAAVLEAQDLHPRAQVRNPRGVVGLEPDASSTIVFVCDVNAPRQIAELRRLCRDTRPATIVAISPPATAAGVRRALDAGAGALVFDSELELTLAAAIHAVASGQSVVPRELLASVEQPTLSHRELQVLALVRQGLTNAEIATRLFLAESTIKSHLASVYSKFGVHSRKEATRALGEMERAAGTTPVAALHTPLERTTP